MSAATERERRSTAGQRMSNLVGKALEDDETFWTNEVWAEEDSGNDSFHESDEDSENRVDEFDSDFNESESDNEAEELAAGEAAELELQREEKARKSSLSKNKKYVDIVEAGRELLQKKKGTSRGKRKRDLMGDGVNFGLVLNLPTNFSAAAAPPMQPALAAAAPAAVAAPTRPIRQAPAKTAVATTATLASTRSRRHAGKRQLRATTQKKTKKRIVSPPLPPQSKKQRQARRFTQEELLLEAATVTEPENERWLLGRKRTQDYENNLTATKEQREAVRGKVVCKYHSRRGCLNTLTFPEMDAVPDILARTQVKPKLPKNVLCVITGKRAMYRDPKTNMGYHDVAAFKELRRRFEAGEPLDQRNCNEHDKRDDESTSASATKDEGEKMDVEAIAPSSSEPTKSQTAAVKPDASVSDANPTEIPSTAKTDAVPTTTEDSDRGATAKATTPLPAPKLSATSPAKPSPTRRSSKAKKRTIKKQSGDDEMHPIDTEEGQPPCKSASSATASMIHNALEAYTKLQQNQQD